MPLAGVVAAVEGRLADFWSRCPVRGFQSDDGSAPLDGSAFLEVQYPYASSDQITIGAPGNNMFREEGAFRLVLNVPRDTNGRADALPWSDELAALFRSKHFGGIPGLTGITTWSPSSPVIDDATDDGNYLVLAIAVPYQANFLA
ncbi:hypothetical protein SAMN02745157_1465 [Kaistia soli DSM 19436]|uniref:Uncharacterized protein n=1 Tax=Kaistia soli DSM 19436 TaxID=1122133 RepID=A0A1M4Y9T1_9HYPH|nr:phage tail terminator-like protein [Kaistia soli]SHF02541.1 hypothetical protein SAMN02745157_1465 [Kaistia soli DSM 19436]